MDDSLELAPIAKMCQFLDPKMRNEDDDPKTVSALHNLCSYFFANNMLYLEKLHYQVVVMLIRICTFFLTWPIFALGEIRRHSCKRQRPLSVFPSTKNYILTLLTTLFGQMLSD